MLTDPLAVECSWPIVKVQAAHPGRAVHFSWCTGAHPKKQGRDNSF